MSKLIVNNLQTVAGVAKNGVIQVVTGTTSTAVVTSSSTWSNIGLSLSITPTTTSSKIYIVCNIPYAIGTNNQCIGGFQLLRNGTSTYSSGASLGLNINYYHNERNTHTFTYLDSPATTSAISYVVQFRTPTNVGSYDQNFTANYGGNLSTIVAMEIAG